ncbi:hypothetical protein LC048_10830 [Mesobacillus subterraneus]|uniref:DUF6671 family protein n=1 Tax=Mesobacillus subterraneus TaxID=285983 RepID=UPI001CFDE6A8|nr:DUF6671 family protein [Mesobacillus subterraneus]WLR57303.1 hypothetical protein LC048_10830 [Mesobacillus subterraneus]
MLKDRSQHPYFNKKGALATMHGKESVIAPCFEKTLQLSLQVPPDINTDELGTFSGEIERKGTPIETVRQKVKMGMELLGSPLGIGNEGSFGPAVHFPLLSEDHEILLWIDQERGIEVVEQVFSTETNFDSITVKRWDTNLEFFLSKVRFPSHALILKPNKHQDKGIIFKGVNDVEECKEALSSCAAVSEDGMVQVATDMRANRNPTRMRVIGEVAEKMAQRLASLCPKCACPGWGVVDVIRGLPCEGCGLRTNWVANEVFGCPSCPKKEIVPRSDGKQKVSQSQCPYCNP